MAKPLPLLALGMLPLVSMAAPARHWCWDSVQPTYSGHQLMASEWVREVSKWRQK